MTTDVRPNLAPRTRPPRSRRGAGAFSLIEVVITVVIIGIVAAIAVPRLSRGAAGADAAALNGNLRVLRDAINRYTADHGGLAPSGAPDGGQIKAVAQLTSYTDVGGETSTLRDATYRFGPYLRAIPPLTVGTRRGDRLMATADGPGVGWIYDESTGDVTANTGTDADTSGKLYSEY